MTARQLGCAYIIRLAPGLRASGKSSYWKKKGCGTRQEAADSAGPPPDCAIEWYVANNKLCTHAVANNKPCGAHWDARRRWVLHYVFSQRSFRKKMSEKRLVGLGQWDPLWPVSWIYKAPRVSRALKIDHVSLYFFFHTASPTCCLINEMRFF